MDENHKLYDILLCSVEPLSQYSKSFAMVTFTFVTHSHCSFMETPETSPWESGNSTCGELVKTCQGAEDVVYHCQ